MPTRLAAGAEPLNTPQVRLVCRDAASSYGWYSNVAICLGRMLSDMNTAANCRESVQRLVRQQPKGIGLVTVIRSSSTPVPEARETLVRAFSEHWSDIRGALFIVEAEGFGAAIQRRLLSAFILAIKIKSRIMVVRSLEEGLPWLVEAAEPGVDWQEMHDLVHRFSDDESAGGVTHTNWPIARSGFPRAR